jgi:diaminopimelate decarboxylase/aspartate kinase
MTHHQKTNLRIPVVSIPPTTTTNTQLSSSSSSGRPLSPRSGGSGGTSGGVDITKAKTPPTSPRERSSSRDPTPPVNVVAQITPFEALERGGPWAWWKQPQKRDQLLALAKQQSPLYVYDEETLQQAVQQVKSLPIDRLFFAVKANPNPDILRIFYEAGLGFECVSPGEVEHVLSLFPDLERGGGIASSRLLFTPNFASRKEYEFGFSKGAIVTLDSVYPLERWAETFANREVMIRLDPQVRQGHHEHVKTAGKQSKFGVTVEELVALPNTLSRHNIKVVGLHAHVGSGILTGTTWGETASFLSTFMDLFPHVKALDLGGGLGITERDDQSPLDLVELGNRLAQFKAEHPGLALWIEPGRFLVANAGVLLATVTQLKKKGDLNYVGVNTGFNSLIRPTLYGAHHRIYNLSRLQDNDCHPVEVVGNICESGDVFGHNRLLPRSTDEDDVILIATTGAYGRSMASNYNFREPAAEHFLNQKK